jgi:hypothetical protein
MQARSVKPSRHAPWVLAAAAAVALTGCAGGDGDGQPSPVAEPPTTQRPAQPGTSAATPAPTTTAPGPRRPDRDPAPDLRVTSFDGRTITLGAFRGTPVVVNFFESW